MSNEFSFGSRIAMGWQALVEHLNALPAADKTHGFEPPSAAERSEPLADDVEGGVAE